MTEEVKIYRQNEKEPALSEGEKAAREYRRQQQHLELRFGAEFQITIGHSGGDSKNAAPRAGMNLIGHSGCPPLPAGEILDILPPPILDLDYTTMKS